MKRFILYFFLSLMLSFSSKAYYVDILADTVCFGSSNTLTGITDIPEILIQEFRWDLDNDGYFDDATGETIQYTFQNFEINLVNLRIITVDDEEFELSEPKELNNYPIPVVNFTISNYCIGDSTQFEDFSEISNGKYLSQLLLNQRAKRRLKSVFHITF